MVILQKCVVCGTNVDVDNGFSSISPEQTFCEFHEAERIVISDIDDIVKSAETELKVLKERATRMRQNICKFETKKNHDYLYSEEK